MIVAFAVPGIVRADERVPGLPAITEAELLAKVVEDPHLARIAANVERARVEEIAAAVRPNPQVSYEREEVFPTGGGLATNYLRFSLPLEISGRRAARRDAARAEVIAISAEGERSRFELEMIAVRVFRTAAYERSRLELLRGERAALASAVEIVRKRTVAGSASGYDLQRIELELAAYDDLTAAAEVQLASARLALGTLVGSPEGMDATDGLAVPADPPALAALLGHELDARPELRATRARRDAADALARSAARAWIPDLALGAGFVRQALSRDSSANGYTATLGLTLPLFDHGQDDRARARAQRRAAQAEQQIIERDVHLALRTRHRALVGNIMRARSVARDQLARLDQLVRSAEAAYRERDGNVVELVDAYTTARDTRLRDLELRRDARLAEIDLWLALGRRP